MLLYLPRTLFAVPFVRHLQQYRCVFRISQSLEPDFTHEIAKEIENEWKGKVNLPLVSEQPKEKFYVLSMFPYPSGNLHMGHVRVYTISDALAQFQRMRGKQVIHPIGWDAFGLPAENAAIEKGIHPAVWTTNNVATMKKQLKDFNFNFDWNMELKTCDPSYYKWTQHLFLLMYDHGLVYKKQALVNWDPVDQTVLADEQVDENGFSWRSNSKVEKRRLNQWFIRTTAFAKNLYDGLQDPNLVEWRDVVKIQEHWIGECTGFSFNLKVVNEEGNEHEFLSVWTDVPELLFGSTFIAISHSNHFNSPEYGGGHDAGDQLLRIKVIHPLTGALLPVYVTDNVNHSTATDSSLGIPGGHDESHKNFALKHNIEVIPVIDRSTNTLLNSKEFSGMEILKAKEKVIDEVRKGGVFVYHTSKKLRDWLISRQRYWGTPIPIINCPSCKTVPVPIQELPVLLPDLSEFSGKGTSLRNAGDWLNTKCPRCGQMALRETDTMDTFVDSSWYFLRYLDCHNLSAPFDPAKIRDQMPVDLYIGGKEHAFLHLFYARFLAHFCHSVGLLKHPEPFHQLLMQGMILGETFQVQETGRYIPREEVDFTTENPTERISGSPIIIEWDKMSKSKFNGVDPEGVIEEYGIDTTRLFVLGNVAPQSQRKWNADLFVGIWNWQRRIWLTLVDFINERKLKNSHNELSQEEIKKYETDLYNGRNYYVKGVIHNFLTTRQLSVAISKLQGLTGDLRKVPKSLGRTSPVYEDALASLIIMLAPLAPHFSSELWTAFCSVASESKNYDLKKPVLHQTFPEVDMDFNMQLVIKLNGTKCDSLSIPRRDLEVLEKNDAVKCAFASEKLKKATQNIKAWSVEYIKYPHYDHEIDFIYIPENNVQKKSLKDRMKYKAMIFIGVVLLTHIGTVWMRK